jgi:5-methylcytosine-specific restriction enzyme subunit McrC
VEGETRFRQCLLRPIPVIRRTLLEWKSIRYGTGDDCIPDWAADRLATVARSSPLGGEGGARILSHGRKDLRAGQVVGIVAAKDCALEILPKIDFASDGDEAVGRIRKQLVHMLAIALNIEISSGAVTELGWQRENLLEILITLFVSKLSDAIHRGMPRAYIAHEGDLPVLRGRLDTIRQFTVLVASSQRLACRYDALSPDIALNQVMKAAIQRLSRVSQSVENQRRLRELALSYSDISDVSVAALPWQELIIDRTNSRWRELVSLARLLLGERFQDTSSGENAGFSLLFEMNTLFEEYVARLLKRAMAGTDISVHVQGGRLHCLEDADTDEQRFMTRPDIILKRADRVLLIIDTKWKRLSAKVDDPKQGVSQGDVYQMMSYGRIYHCPRLMLLYPLHNGLAQPEGPIAVHRISGSTDMLTIAALDISSNVAATDRLRNLISPYVGMEVIAAGSA